MGAVLIRRYLEIPGGAEHIPAIDAIFFEASSVKDFTDDAARAAFRERWLGRYLTHYPEWAYLAFDAEGHLLGYLCGCIDDPNGMPRFADIVYFSAFQFLTINYPAHLHINLDHRHRGQGTGTLLIDAFVRDATDAGVQGMHLVTSRGARNVRFYEQCGFRELGALIHGKGEIVFLARKLP